MSVATIACIACIAMLGASIHFCMWTIYSLARIAASNRRNTATLSRIMARSVSVERRAMAEWRQP